MMVSVLCCLVCASTLCVVCSVQAKGSHWDAQLAVFTASSVVAES